MTDSGGPGQKKREPSPAELEARRRGRDCIVLFGAAVALLGLAAAPGWIAWQAALSLAAGLALFTVLFYLFTAPAEALPPDPTEMAAEARRRLEQARAVRQSLIGAIPEPALYIDAQGRVEAANEAARRHFRFVAAEPLLSVVVRRPELLEAVAAAMRQRKPQRFEFVERAETDRTFSCVAAPIDFAGASGVLITMHDLTEIRRSELARVDFLANASHELRTPLTSLTGFIETLRGPAREDSEARDRFLAIMQVQAERMSRLISDLLSLSRIELVEHTQPDSNTDLGALVAAVCDAMGPVASEHQVQIEVHGGDLDIRVTGVQDELSQVVQNLVDNAIKYSEPGQIVVVELLAGRPRAEAARLAGRRWSEAGHMSIATPPKDQKGLFAGVRVSDSGPGIQREHLPRLAERFYRIDQGRGLRPGTGLGLAIVKHIVTRHRGEFLVESEPGRGTAFTVLLPANESSASMAHDAPETASIAPV